MSTISEYANKLWLSDTREISMLENFFTQPDIIQDLRQAEKYRIRRFIWIAIGIVISFWALFLLGFGWIVQMEIWDTWKYRPSEWGDWVIWGVIWSTIITGIIIKIFHAKIEWAIKQKILSKLSKEIYSKLEYDENTKYGFWDLDKLASLGFIRWYDTVESIEDSIAFTIQEDGKYIIVQGYELKTSRITYDSKWRRHKHITNHCYLLKAKFPSARIPLKDNLFIKRDYRDGFHITKIIIPILGWLLWVWIFSSVFPQSGFIIFVGAFMLWTITYFIQKFFINRKRISVENIEFEKIFDVNCSDPIGSRMIVTPAFMDRLVQFSKKSKYQYELLYQSNCFYIKWNVGNWYLEINTWKNIETNITTFLDWYIQMKEIVLFIFDMRMLYFSKTDPEYIQTDVPPEYDTMTIPPLQSKIWGIAKDVWISIAIRLAAGLLRR